MNNNSYYQKQASASRRQVSVIKNGMNETPTAKQYRLIEATVRGFIKEFPDRAVEIMREMVPQMK